MFIKRRRKTIALLLSVALILSGNTMSFGATADNLASSDDFDIIKWDYEHLPELQDVSYPDQYVINKDEDHSSIRWEPNSSTIFIDGSGTVGKSKRDDMVSDAGGEDNIVHIVAGKDITHFAGEIFKNSRSLPNLESVTIEEGHSFDEFGRSSFAVNKSLKDLEVRPGKKTAKEQGYEISHHAFRLCENLENPILNNVWHLGQRAFQRDTKIDTMDLGYLHHMRGDAFEGCTSLETIKVDDDNPYFEVKDDGFLYKKFCPYYTGETGGKVGLYNIEVPALMSVPNAKSGEILKPSKKTKTIAYGAAAGNTKITKAKAITGVKQIQARAFYDCKNLKEIYISKSVTHIGNEAFSRFNGEVNDSPSDDYDEHPYAKNDDGDRDENIAEGYITDVYYSGTEEDWKKIKYDKYDKKMEFCSDGGSVADNMTQIGLSDNVIMHYNYMDDPDIIAPEVVKSGEKLSVSCAVILAKSKNITFDTDFLGFTPDSYTVTAADTDTNVKGIKINKKKWTLTAKNKAGSYDIELSSGSSKKTIRLYVEKPVMKKQAVKLNTEGKGNTYSCEVLMLSGVTFLSPEEDRYESKKPSVAEIDQKTGIITAKSKGSTKITVYICDKPFKANFKVNVDKVKKKKEKETKKETDKTEIGNNTGDIESL